MATKGRLGFIILGGLTYMEYNCKMQKMQMIICDHYRTVQPQSVSNCTFAKSLAKSISSLASASLQTFARLRCAASRRPALFCSPLLLITSDIVQRQLRSLPLNMQPPPPPVWSHLRVLACLFHFTASGGKSFSKRLYDSPPLGRMRAKP